MKTIDRKQFLKLAGLFTGVVSLGVLPSCEKEKKIESISLDEISKYRLITTEDKYNPVMLVKYNKLQGYLVVSMLNTRNDVILEVEIARELNNNKEQAIEDFRQNYNVTSDNLCLPTFQKYFGLKDEYTINEINYILEQTEKEKNDEKKLVK